MALALATSDGDSSKFLDFVNSQLAAQSNIFSQIDPSSQQISENLQEQIDKNTQRLAGSRPQGAFTIKALITSVFETTKTARTGQGTVVTFVVNARLSKDSISPVYIASQNIVESVDDLGSPIFYVPVPCDLSKKKKDALEAKRQQEETEAKANSLVGNIKGSKSIDKRAPYARSQRNVDDRPASAEEIASGMNEPPKSSYSSTKMITQGGSRAPLIEEPSDAMDGVTNNDLPSNGNGHLQQSDGGGVVVDDGSSQQPDIDMDQGGVGVDYYYADQIHGTPYLNKPIMIWLPLSIGKDVTFFTDDAITESPTPYSLVEMEVCGSPYVDPKNGNRYNARSFSIIEIKKSEPIPLKELYQFFEKVGQSTFMYTKFPTFLEASKSGFIDEKAKMKVRFNDDNSYWFVLGDELTASLAITSDDKKSEKVWRKLERNVNTSKFQKKDMKTNAPSGVIPYRFNCIQFKGLFSPSNPTTMKYTMTININAKHISPISDGSGESVPSLGITSLYALTSIIPAIYPHIKMCVIAKEDMETASKNNLNYDRFQMGIAMKDKNWIHKPYATESERMMLAAFFLPMAVSKVILLPIHTIRSVGIPVTPEYFLKSCCNKFKPVLLENMEGEAKVKDRVHNKNDSLFCLSELTEKSIQDIFTHYTTYKEVQEGKKGASVSGEAYNIYAVPNIYYKSDSSFIIPPLHHHKLSPEAGVVYIEALRNIIVVRGSSVKRNTFVKAQSIPDNDYNRLFPGIGMVEKYKAFLKWSEKNGNMNMGVDPQKLTWLHQLDVTDIAIISSDGNLCVYFYAIKASEDENWKDVVESRQPENKVTQFLCSSGGVGDNNSSSYSTPAATEMVNNINDGIENDNIPPSTQIPNNQQDVELEQGNEGGEYQGEDQNDDDDEGRRSS